MDLAPAKADHSGGCCSTAAIADAKSVASKLGIAHHVINLREDFKERVINNFIEEYKNGRTPNPCVRCNQLIKFDLLLKKADELGADYVSTGHYAVISGTKKAPLLKKSPDRTKDQSYFLYRMPPEALKRVLFPVGAMTKMHARKIAAKLGLDVAGKKDSQEICFIHDNDYGRFLSEKIPETVKPGPILDTDGNRVGMHRGIAFYTIGQRRGIGLQFAKPFYVVSIDKENNAVVVGDEKETFGKMLIASDLVWTSATAPSKAFAAKAKIRYATEETPAVITPLEGGYVRVTFKKPVKSITPGQSVVFYKKDVVLGGGIICQAK
jgi:tRNA-specific 2-thiouridylase